MRPRPTTLTRRVTIRLAIAAVLALLAQTVWVAWSYQYDLAELDELQEDAVERVLETLSTRLQPDGEIAHFLASRYDFAAVDYATFDQQGTRRDGTLQIDPALLSDAGKIHEVFLVEKRGDGNRWLGARRAVSANGTSYLIFAELRFHPDVYPLEVVVAEMLETAVFPTLPIVGLMYLVSVFAIRGSLSGLRRAARDAERLNPQKRGQSLSEAGLPAEVLSLVQAVNAGIAALERQVDEQRAFAGEVAHELRTPLAIMALEVDRVGGAQGERLRADIATLSRRIDQLLAAARAGALRLNDTDRADLAEIAADVVGRYAPIAMRRGVALSLEGQERCPVLGDATSIAAAVLNVIENAVRASPSGRSVRVTVGDGPTLTVADEGAGIDPAVRDRLLEPYRRGDTRGSGAGLGLSIVRRTMDAHGGSLVLTSPPDGGTHVILNFRAP